MFEREYAELTMKIIPQQDFPKLTMDPIDNYEECEEYEDGKNSYCQEISIEGWAEKDDYLNHSEDLEKFGGHIWDCQNDPEQSIRDKCNKCGRPRLSCKYLFETRTSHNIFGLDLGDGGTMQEYGCVVCGTCTSFSCG